MKPYVKSNKNDARDAEAICEAMSRPNMRFVTVKTVEQQDIQATHRIREELKVRRTAKANQIRGLVAEYGLVAPKQPGIPACCDPVLAGRCGERFNALLPFPAAGSVGRPAYAG